MTLFFLCLLSYFAGSIPFGKIAGRFYDVDIQKHGSGNIGFANTVRVLGWKAGALVLIGDILKGYLPALLALEFVGASEALLVGLAALCGHVFPVWLGFRGGKGIATGLGFTAAISLPLAGIAVAVYIASFAIYRKSAPASLTSTWVMPIAASALQLGTGFVVFYGVMALFISWTHRENIRHMRGSLQRVYD